jgi:REP element-mobilizing transposase RayT
VDGHLDLGNGACYMGNPAIADVVAGALRFFEGQRYKLRAWVVMPNHVHAVVLPLKSHTLSDILHSWKSFTSHRLKKCLVGNGAIWQSESYDHLIRDDEELARCCAYTTRNPVTAGLCGTPESWPWSSAFERSKGANRSPSGGTPLEPAGGDAHAT